MDWLKFLKDRLGAPAGASMSADIAAVAANAATAAGHNNPDAAGTALGIIDTTDKLNKLIATSDIPAATKYPVSVVLKSILATLMSATADPTSFDYSKHSLEALYNELIVIAGLAAKTVAGVPQVKHCTVDLHNDAGTYDIATCSTQDIIIDSLIFTPHDDLSDDAGFTGVSIQDNETTPNTYLSQTNGVKANLTAYANMSYSQVPVKLRVGKKIQITIYGGTATADPSTCDVEIRYCAITDGGTL